MQLEKLLADNRAKYEEMKARGLKLNLSRGKPSPDILDLSKGFLGALDAWITEDGTDIRNYGGPAAGIAECRRLFSDLLGIPEEKMIVGGNSSLCHMYNIYAALHLFGAPNHTPWGKQGKIKILCPCPGYDRHFNITKDFGAEMIAVPMTDEGPDMDIVTRLAAGDSAIKGIWCVPLYSNPNGLVYSDDTVKRLASMKAAAPDFRIFWDNAYGVHHVWQEHKIADILKLTEESGCPDRAYYFFSTSKILFPGGGVSLVASGLENIKSLTRHIGNQTVGYDKIAQFRLVKFFGGDAEAIRQHMRGIAAILRPKFELVLKMLDEEFSGTGLLRWRAPRGGYFLSVDTLDGCAKKVVALARDAGVIFTEAGATYPDKADPNDSNIRIAPTYPSLSELRTAMGLFAVCVKIATLEKYLTNRRIIGE
jgi:DNA-binding transcriptional MocR family regulator